VVTGGGGWQRGCASRRPEGREGRGNVTRPIFCQPCDGEHKKQATWRSHFACQKSVSMAPCALSFFLGPEWGLPSPEPPRTRGAAAPHTPGSGRAHFHGGGQGAVAPPWTHHHDKQTMTPTQSPNQCAQVRITIECTKLTTTIKSGRVYCESKNPERKTQPCLTRSHSVRSETLLGRTRIPTPTLSDEIQQKTTEKQKVNMDLTFASIFDRTSKGSKGQRIDER